jgi:hypothetical protein
MFRCRLVKEREREIEILRNQHSKKFKPVFHPFTIAQKVFQNRFI